MADAPPFDVAIVGAGIAGASLAFELANEKSVLILEREDMPGYHTTGRSAAFFSEAYGAPAMRALTAASRAFFESPPAGFAEQELLRASGALYVAREDQRDALEHMAEEQTAAGLLEKRDAAYARAQASVLAPGYVAACLWEPGASEIDVAALHQGYLRGAKRRGAILRCEAELFGAQYESGLWRVATRAGVFEARVLVNAAGAWADAIAEAAGVAPLGLVPFRRTVCIVPGIDDTLVRRWPLVIDVDEDFYFKPDAGNILLSPADETPCPPCDAAPDEIDIAIAVERFERATETRVSRVLRSWAGLRTMAADRTLVLGFDPDQPAFFWLAGQGGQGIQTAPASACFAATLIKGCSLPEAFAKMGVSADALSPGRFSRKAQ
ncbi:MAG: FAD-binding oxidoreductase [Hyphomonadaceae bacterium]|nr:FAD-binding oxidoreductase [Hyphomonadaceae bacterium]